MTAKNAPQQLVRIGSLQNLDRVLVKFGLDADAELAGLGMNPAMFQYGDMLVHIRILGELLDHFSELTRCEDFALELGAAQDLSMSGALAMLLQTCATLGDALQEISRYQRTHHAQPVDWQLVDLGDTVAFSVTLDTPELTLRQRRLLVDLGLCQVGLAVRELTAAQVAPVSVRLHSANRGRGPGYQRFFDAPIESDARMDALVFPREALDFALGHPDSKLHASLQRQIPAIAIDTEESRLAQGVSAIIRSLLPTGDYSLDRVARCYACDKRTLQRYLRDEADTTYQSLLDEVRFDMVKRYLRDSTIPITQVTALAGFTDPSNFTRAFHKRFGIPPKQWREQQTGEKSSSRRRRLRLRVS